MLHSKFQGHHSFGSRADDFEGLFYSMGMMAILVT